MSDTVAKLDNSPSIFKTSIPLSYANKLQSYLHKANINEYSMCINRAFDTIVVVIDRREDAVLYRLLDIENSFNIDYLFNVDDDEILGKFDDIEWDVFIENSGYYCIYR